MDMKEKLEQTEEVPQEQTAAAATPEEEPRPETESQEETEPQEETESQEETEPQEETESQEETGLQEKSEPQEESDRESRAYENQMKKRRTFWIVGLLAGLLFIGMGIHSWYRSSHVFIEDAVYARSAESLDLRGSGISRDHFDQLRRELPDCRILWDVPFQGASVPSDTRELTLASLTEEDLEMLQYLPELSYVDATACRDYEALTALKQDRPQVRVDYVVTLGDTDYPQSTDSLEFSGDQVDAAQLEEKLAYLPQLRSVHFTEPEIPGADLMKLTEIYPQVEFTWEKTLFDMATDTTTQELDLSEFIRDMESLDEVRDAVDYLPGLQELFLGRPEFSDEEVAAFREEMRPRFKTVWEVSISGLWVRTDITYFMPIKYDHIVSDHGMQTLRYCEDLLCVDVGHMNMRDVSWVEGMPHLKYLILADSILADITPLSCLKELKYLELFMTNVRDVSPLVGCTALEDLSLSVTHVEPEPLSRMPWLKNLWINRCGITPDERQLLTESLPDTHIEFDHGWPTGGGWRQLQNYFDMRDLLEMPYNAW